MIDYFCISRHWLYGDKVLQETSPKSKTQEARSRQLHNETTTNGSKSSSITSQRQRGWFPRQCAVEVFANDHRYEECKSKSIKQSRSKDSNNSKSKPHINGEGKKER